jgi:dihydrofolate synthase
MARRITKEERALDSFHNLLFSLTKFYETTGAWPDHVTIISNGFKRARFLDLHCRAIRWRLDRTGFVGIDPEYMAVDLARAESVRDGEKRNGFDAWENDMFGTGEVLEGKRMRRNPWGVCQLLFEDEETRKRSKINSRIVGHREILGDDLQPWES